MRRVLVLLLVVTGCSDRTGDASDAPAGVPGPDSRTGTPDTRTGTPDSRTGTPDSRTGTPDSRTGTPDAGPGAPDAPPGSCPAPPASASASTLDAYARLSAARQLAGVGCATLVDALDTAAAKHCAYY